MTPIENPRNPAQRTTATWEVELLISGVAVFAMLQLPGQLDDALLMLQSRLDGNWRQLALLVYVYAKSAALILAITFVLHLLLRARWIALTGMHSVYPGGIRWEKFKFGPLLRDIELAHSRPLPEIIERADNRASVVFAIGVMMAQVMIAIAVAAIGAFAGAVGLHTVTGWLDTPRWLMVLFSLVMGPYIAASLIDRMLAHRMPAGSRLRHGLQRILECYAKIGFARGNNPVMALLASHDGDRKTMLLTFTMMTLALGGVAVSMVFVKAPERFGNYSMFPRSSATQPDVDSAHYDDLRNPLRDDAKPYIQSLVIHTSYLKLLIPYQPLRDEAAMQARCQHADALEKEAQARARLACLASLHSVMLDGRPLPNLRYDIATDPRTDRPALLAMIDLRDLPRGRHELRVAHPLRSDRKPDQDEPDPGFDSIPFWR